MVVHLTYSIEFQYIRNECKICCSISSLTFRRTDPVLKVCFRYPNIHRRYRQAIDGPASDASIQTSTNSMGTTMQTPFPTFRPNEFLINKNQFNEHTSYHLIIFFLIFFLTHSSNYLRTTCTCPTQTEMI